MRKMITSTCADCGTTIHARRRLIECYSCGVSKHRARAVAPVRASNQWQVADLARDALLALGSTRATAAELRVILDAIKMTTGCADCGYHADPRALDLAHVDEATKYRTRSGRVEQPSDLAKAKRDGYPRYSQTVVLAEAAKCDVLCATCHRLRTFEDRATPSWERMIERRNARASR